MLPTDYIQCALGWGCQLYGCHLCWAVLFWYSYPWIIFAPVSKPSPTLILIKLSGLLSLALIISVHWIVVWWVNICCISTGKVLSLNRCTSHFFLLFTIYRERPGINDWCTINLSMNEISYVEFFMREKWNHWCR